MADGTSVNSHLDSNNDSRPNSNSFTNTVLHPEDTKAESASTPNEALDLFMTDEEIANVLRKMLESLPPERNFDLQTESIIVTLFVLLISFGLLGNSLVCYVVAKNPRMRTPRNVFIINLAVSDLTLCLFTQPFNLVKVLTTDWRMGRFMCKLVSMVAGTNVFVSTASITAIALDRFQVIVYPTRRTMKDCGCVVSVLFIWLGSILLACPLLVLNDISGFAPIEDVTLYEACVEDASMQLEKKIYSMGSMLIQYIVPIVIVSAAHAQISRKLKYRMTNRESSTGNGVPSAINQKRTIRAAKKKRKTNLLLFMIAVVYASSWLPLNIFNIMADFNWNMAQAGKGLLVPICHMLVLCSACTNPLLYGWLNENFRREFVKAFRGFKCLDLCLNVRGHSANSRNSTTIDLTSGRLSTVTRQQTVNIPRPF